MKKFKSLLIGAGVALINVSPILTQAVRPERCSGNCGSCGFSCIQTTVGMAVIGIGALTWKKIRLKFNAFKLRNAK